MKQQKKRTKKYGGPKYIAKNPMVTFLGSMHTTHAEHLQKTNLINHAAMQAMVQGRGDKEMWDRLVGAINIAIVMCGQGIGPEYREQLLAGMQALLDCGVRSVKKGRFAFTGDELRVMNEAMSIHDLQLLSVRSIDVDRAAAEVVRRLNHRINSTSVMAKIREKEAEASEADHA